MPDRSTNRREDHSLTPPLAVSATVEDSSASLLIVNRSEATGAAPPRVTSKMSLARGSVQTGWGVAAALRVGTESGTLDSDN